MAADYDEAIRLDPNSPPGIYLARSWFGSSNSKMIKLWRTFNEAVPLEP